MAQKGLIKDIIYGSIIFCLALALTLVSIILPITFSKDTKAMTASLTASEVDNLKAENTKTIVIDPSDSCGGFKLKEGETVDKVKITLPYEVTFTENDGETPEVVKKNNLYSETLAEAGTGEELSDGGDPTDLLLFSGKYDESLFVKQLEGDLYRITYNAIKVLHAIDKSSNDLDGIKFQISALADKYTGIAALSDEDAALDAVYVSFAENNEEIATYVEDGDLTIQQAVIYANIKNDWTMSTLEDDMDNTDLVFTYEITGTLGTVHTFLLVTDRSSIYFGILGLFK